MSENLKNSITAFLKPQVTELGFASVDRFAEAPEKHHPKRICKNAETVIVFGIVVPRGMLKSPDYNLYALHRSYHSAYMRIDEISLALCNYIESLGKYLAVPIPSYAPMVFHQFAVGHPVFETRGGQRRAGKFRAQRPDLSPKARRAAASGRCGDGRGDRSGPDAACRSLPAKLHGLRQSLSSQSFGVQRQIQ